MLAAQFSGRQPASVALDVGLSVMRLALPLVMVLVVQELISREFERRYYLSSLSFPSTRAHFLLSRFASTIVLCLAVLLVWSVALALTVSILSQGYEQATPVALGWHYVVTVLFIGLDMLLLLALATLLAVTASTPSFVLIGTFGFMLVARSFTAIIELLTRNTYVVGDAEQYRAGVGLLGYLLPDLGALDVRMITLYGRMEFLPQDWPWLVLSSLGYCVGLLALAGWALNRKRFA
jgi:ABC-type transport system involved in multi-copper enzyme maturation permease subunit